MEFLSVKLYIKEQSRTRSNQPEQNLNWVKINTRSFSFFFAPSWRGDTFPPPKRIWTALWMDYFQTWKSRSQMTGLTFQSVWVEYRYQKISNSIPRKKGKMYTFLLIQRLSVSQQKIYLNWGNRCHLSRLLGGFNVVPNRWISANKAVTIKTADSKVCTLVICLSGDPDSILPHSVQHLFSPPIHQSQASTYNSPPSISAPHSAIIFPSDLLPVYRIHRSALVASSSLFFSPLHFTPRSIRSPVNCRKVANNSLWCGMTSPLKSRHQKENRSHLIKINSAVLRAEIKGCLNFWTDELSEDLQDEIFEGFF